MSRPPSTADVLAFGPVVLGAFAVPIAFLSSLVLKEKPTKEEQDEQSQEAERRAQVVKDMVKSLEKAEAAKLEEKRQKEDETRQKEGERRLASNEAEVKHRSEDMEVTTDASDCALQRLSARLMGNGTYLAGCRGKQSDVVEEAEENDDDDVGNLQWATLRDKCAELADISPAVVELEKGVEWCGKLLLKELTTATRKTEKQKDVRYSDGQILENLLNCPLELDDLAKTAQYKVNQELRENIRTAYKKAYGLTKVRKRKDLVKAVQMVLMAREAIPWVILSNVVSTTATVISTLCLHYRAEVLQALRESKNSRRPFYRGAAAMLIVELIAAAARTLENQLNMRADKKMGKSIQVKLFLALMNKDATFWSEQPEPYRNFSHVLSLPFQLKNALSTPRTILNSATQIAVQAMLVRAKSSRMLYSMLALHWAKFFARKGINMLSDFLRRWATRSIVMPSQDKYTWVYAVNPEYVQMFQSFARQELEAKDLAKYMQARTRQQELFTTVQAIMAPAHSAVQQAGNMTEYLSMGQLVESGNVNITEAETVMHYASQVGSCVEDTYTTMSYVQNHFAPLAKAHDLISIPPKIDPVKGIYPDRRATGHFVFNHVKFSYPGRKSILKDVCFEVKPGSIVGITGETGCGKSTCLRLVERFYDVTGGTILLDGQDIREYNPNWLRSQIVAVAQDPKLLPMTIRENLTFGCVRRPSMEEVEEACRSANIWDTLMDARKFPNGLDTRMSITQNVSGGEKQRICIARAILANPPILLLDEATSSLDEVSQAHVQDALNKLMKGRTTLVVAHRLSTIKDSHKIIGMRDGKAEDDGTHEELLKKPNGVWRQLWAQASTNEAATATKSEAAAAIATKNEAAEEIKPSNTEELTPTLVPTLQRSTTSTTAKYDVLRQALAGIVAAKEQEQRQEKLQNVMTIIDELESDGTACLGSQEASLTVLTDISDSSPNGVNIADVTTPASRHQPRQRAGWNSVRNSANFAAALTSQPTPRAVTLQRQQSKDTLENS